MSHIHSRCEESIRAIKLGVKNTQGQATLEYALVLFLCLIVITSLGVIYHFVQNGAVVQLATQAASHTMHDSLLDLAKDVLSF